MCGNMVEPLGSSQCWTTDETDYGHTNGDMLANPFNQFKWKRLQETFMPNSIVKGVT